MELFLIAIAWILGILVGLYLKIGIAFFVVVIIIICILKERNRYLKLFCAKRYIILLLISFLLSFFNMMRLEHKFNETYKDISEEIGKIWGGEDGNNFVVSLSSEYLAISI